MLCLRLRSHLPSAVSSIQRVLFLSTTAASPARFDVEGFLITRFGLTPAQARKSSRHLAHLKSPSKPEAVLACLADVGVAAGDVASAVSKEPRLLCFQVDKTLKPRIGMLRDIGLSVPQISHLIATNPNLLWTPNAIPRLAFYLSLLGSFENLCSVMNTRWARNLLFRDVESVVKPNLAFLQQCGLYDCEVFKILVLAPIVLLKPERLKAIVVCADKLGVPRHSAMYKYALTAVYFIGPERVDAKLDFLKNALGCSKAELRIAVSRMPKILTLQETNISHTVEFLKMEVGLEAEYIVHRPALIAYSVKKRLMPRHYVIKVLKAKGLVKKDIDFAGVVGSTEKAFTKRFLDRFKETVPGLTSAYAASSDGKFIGSF